MIDPHWQLVDLDAVTWRTIGRFFGPEQYIQTAQPDEHALFVLHEHGVVQRVVDSKFGVRRDMALTRIDDPQAYAQELYARSEWQRVHVIDKTHLFQVARLAQETPKRELTLDQYYHHVYQLLWGEPTGYVSIPAHPGHWHGWTYEYVQQVIRQLALSPASLALGVFADEKLLIGLILVCEDGLVRKVTTFEALHAQSFVAGLGEDTLKQVWLDLAETIAPPAGVLLCSQAVFEDWIEHEEKLQVLQSARQAGLAYWRWLG